MDFFNWSNPFQPDQVTSHYLLPLSQSLIGDCHRDQGWPRVSQEIGGLARGQRRGRQLPNCQPNAEPIIARDANGQAKSPLVDAQVCVIANTTRRWLLDHQQHAALRRRHEHHFLGCFVRHIHSDEQKLACPYGRPALDVAILIAAIAAPRTRRLACHSMHSGLNNYIVANSITRVWALWISFTLTHPVHAGRPQAGKLGKA
jgi:hypothetical protein